MQAAAQGLVEGGEGGEADVASSSRDDAASVALGRVEAEIYRIEPVSSSSCEAQGTVEREQAVTPHCTRARS